MRPPELFLPPEHPRYDDVVVRVRLLEAGRPAYPPFAEREAAKLADSLRESGWFRNVAVEDGPVPAEAVVVEAIDGPPDLGGENLYWKISFLSLGLVPVFEEAEQGAHFRRVGVPNAELSCSLREDRVFGWLGLALRLSPNWASELDREARAWRVRQCLETQGVAVFEGPP